MEVSLIIVTGDFNDYSGGEVLTLLEDHGLVDVSTDARGTHGAKATYKFRGEWRSLDHILLSGTLASRLQRCFIADHPFLLEDDKTYGGKKPLRSGYRNSNGFSDHLPLVADFLVNAE